MARSGPQQFQKEAVRSRHFRSLIEHHRTSCIQQQGIKLNKQDPLHKGVLNAVRRIERLGMITRYLEMFERM